MLGTLTNTIAACLCCQLNYTCVQHLFKLQFLLLNKHTNCRRFSQAIQSYFRRRVTFSSHFMLMSNSSDVCNLPSNCSHDHVSENWRQKINLPKRIHFSHLQNLLIHWASNKNQVTQGLRSTMAKALQNVKIKLWSNCWQSLFCPAL